MRERESRRVKETRIEKCIWKVLQKDQKTIYMLRGISPRGNQKRLLWEIWKKRFFCIGVLLLLSITLFFYCRENVSSDSLLKEDKYIERAGEDSSVEMLVSGDDGENTWQKKMEIEVRQRKFSEEEKKELDKQTSEYLEKNFLGKNESAEHVSTPLVFAEQVPDTEVQVEWSYDSTYIMDSGGLRKTKIPEQGVDTDVVAVASCRNWEKSYRYSVHLDFGTQTIQEREISEARKAVKNALRKNKTVQTIELPGQIGDTALTYQRVEGEPDYIPVYVLLLVLISLPFVWKEKQKKNLQRREDQMMSDHPEILNKVMLLLGAGLTFRGAVERMVAEYERSQSEGGEIRYAYEELCIMVQEMKDGVSEVMATERFGKRCRLLPYLKFSSIITQNIKKGSEGMIEILTQEAGEALEQRKERALRQGETAGTKLLLPMMLMLGLVMAIIMVPAFMTM